MYPTTPHLAAAKRNSCPTYLQVLPLTNIQLHILYHRLVTTNEHNMSTPSSLTTAPALTGSCQCGKVTYTSSVLPDELTNCHCKTCRKLSGGPFLTFGRFPLSAVTFTSAPPTKTKYSEIAERTHCSACGTPISMLYMCQSDVIGITAGSIDEESVRGSLPKISEHIFVSEKASW